MNACTGLICFGLSLSATAGWTAVLTVCEVLDNSKQLNGSMVTVHGYLQGSSRHGYSLYASAEGRDDPCPGWRRRYLTAPSIIELGEALEPTGATSYAALITETKRRASGGDFASIRVEVVGQLIRKDFFFINKQSEGGFAGNGFGENGGRAVILRPKSIRKLSQVNP
jgi:hypothetical protein